MSDLVRDHLMRFATAQAERSTFESHWEEIAARLFPSHKDTFTAFGYQNQFNQGAKKTELMFDATAALALQRFSAVLESLLTPQASQWHRLIPSDPSLKKNAQVRRYLDDVNARLFRYRYRPKANFSGQIQPTYMGLGAYGSGVLFVDALPGGGIRYRHVHLAEAYFIENHQGLVDTLYRKFQLTAQQAIKRFGESTLPEQIISASKSPTQKDTRFEFLHCVYPREDYDPERLDEKGMQYESIYISCAGQREIKRGGYASFPYPLSRYTQSPGEVYGRSPAMLGLPAIKVLNEEKKTVLKQGHRIVDPVLLLHDDGQISGFSLKPGALNYGAVNADGRALVQTLPSGNIAVGKDMMDDERAVINDLFLVSLFQILVETPAMTATEVLERAREKGMLLAPTMGRQQSELLGPLVERELDILARQGLLPPPPAVFEEAGASYTVEYDSPMARMQRAENAAGLFRTLDLAVNYAKLTGDPSPFDWVDFDEAMPEIMDINAVPARWVRTMEGVEAVRAQRAQQQQIQQAIEAAPALAGAAKAIPGLAEGAAA